MPRKPTQPQLLPKLEPIGESDGLSFNDLSTRYRCQCGNTLETGIRLEAIQCVKCGNPTKPV